MNGHRNYRVRELGLTGKTKTKNANMSIIRGIVLHNCKRARCGCDLRAMVLLVVVLLCLVEGAGGFSHY